MKAFDSISQLWFQFGGVQEAMEQRCIWKKSSAWGAVQQVRVVAQLPERHDDAQHTIWGLRSSAWYQRSHWLGSQHVLVHLHLHATRLIVAAFMWLDRLRKPVDQPN